MNDQPPMTSNREPNADIEHAKSIVEEQLRQELQIGFGQADAGDIEEWNVEEMFEEAHRRFSSVNP